MTTKEFLILTAQMRRAQKRYYYTRSRRDLDEAKKLSEQVDAVLERHVPEHLRDNTIF